jgi:hypothetical protein
MIEEIARFEHELRQAALELVRAVLLEESARRDRADATSAAAPRRRGRPTAVHTPAADATAPEPLPPAKPAVPPARKRQIWTREMVVDELATWLLSGTVVEAAFLNRHGRPGLVPAAKRIFGRFDAALNAANLHLAQRYPEGIPTPKHTAAGGQ